jgi:hypothetical protein
MSSGKLDTKAEEQMTHWLSFFEGEALAEFISYVSPGSGNESLFGGEMAYPPDKDRVAVEPGSMVIPKSEPREARGGFSVSFYAQAYNEDSQSTSVEVYTDLSVGGEVGVELPIKKVAKFKFSASAKKGRKTTDKEESKETNRAGMSITRTYKVSKLERDIFKADFVKTMHGISKPSGNPLKLPAPQLPSKVSSRVTGILPQEIQSGYKIVPSEGGPPWGPLWNTYADQSPVEGSALDNVNEILINEKLELAKILAFEGAD